MTAEEISALRALFKVATPGPLTKRCLGPGSCHFSIMCGNEEIATWLTEANADFFIAAHALMIEIVTEAAPATRSYAVGDRVRIVGGEHDGRLGVVIETDLGDLALRVDAEDGEVVTRAFAIGGGRGGGGAFTIGNGGGNGGGGQGQVGGGTTISIGDRKLVARGGRGGFVASLADFDLEPAGGQ